MPGDGPGRPNDDRPCDSRRRASVARDSGSDPERTRRLIGLADDVGIDDIAALWCDAGAATLPGTLWSLYLLRTWVHRDGIEAARLFAAGQRVAECRPSCGVADPPGPREVAELGDAVLTSAFDGDFAIALERAAAACRVVAAGRAHLADDCPDEDESFRQTRLADRNLRMCRNSSKRLRSGAKTSSPSAFLPGVGFGE